MANSPRGEVDQWLALAPDDRVDRRELNQVVLDKVREHGYSLLTAAPDVLQRHEAVLSAFELPDRLPRHERAMRKATSELAEHFTPDLVSGLTYDFATIVVLLPPRPGLPPMALRMTGLPQNAPTDQIESWIDSLRQIAQSADATAAAGL